MTSQDELCGKVALVTGASGGIGGACARDLRRCGVSLALTYSSGRSSIDRLVGELGSSSTRAGEAHDIKISIHQVDVGKPEDLARLFEEVLAEHGQHPDIVVSNAGYGKRIPKIEEISIEEWDYTIRVNLTATFILCKLAIPHMTERRWGRIITMGSISGYGGGINGCHYAASKAGLMGMVKNLASKHAACGISINDVAPAMIGNTGMITDEKMLVGTPGDVRNIPVGRLGMPEEVANVVTMLCKTGYLTGQSILLSGGLK